MKLRIKGDSLRLRLTQGEIRALAEQGAVEDRVSFPGGTALAYRLQSDSNSNDILASYEGNIISVRVPAPLVARWSGTDLVSLSATQPLARGELRILLEKDWACLAPREDEDESDHFPHPNAGAQRC